MNKALHVLLVFLFFVFLYFLYLNLICFPLRFLCYSPQKDIKMAKKTVAGLSNKYVSLEKRHESPNF